MQYTKYFKTFYDKRGRLSISIFHTIP